MKNNSPIDLKNQLLSVISQMQSVSHLFVETGKDFSRKRKKFFSQIPFSFSYLWAGIPFGKNGSISGIFLRIWLRFPPFASNVRNCCLRQWISYFILSMILFHRWKLIVDFVCLLAINLIWLLLTLLMIRIPIGGIILWNGMRKDITNFI